MGHPVLPPSIDEVYEEGIPVCALLEMLDRYCFHSTPAPASKAFKRQRPRAGGQSKRSSRNLFHTNAPGLEGRTFKRKHCLFDDVLVLRYLLEGPRSFQRV